MPRQDNRLLLRVMVKIMLVISSIFFIYILLAGFLGNGEEDKTVLIDVSHISVGEAAYFQPGRRRIIVVNKPAVATVSASQQYFVGYAQDTYYGCEVRLDAEAGRLKAQCADVEYDLDGHLLKGSRHHEDLKQPQYRWLDRHRLSIQVR